jgi:archaellum component FlaC
MEHATATEHEKEIARLHTLISHIQKRAESLQQAASELDDPAREPLSAKVDTLKETADDLREEVAVLERA